MAEKTKAELEKEIVSLKKSLSKAREDARGLKECEKDLKATRSLCNFYEKQCESKYLHAKWDAIIQLAKAIQSTADMSMQQ